MLESLYQYYINSCKLETADLFMKSCWEKEVIMTYLYNEISHKDKNIKKQFWLKSEEFTWESYWMK